MAREISIEELPNGCILSVNQKSITIGSPDDALAIISSLTDMLKIQYPTVYLLLPEVKYKRKLDELSVFLSMCKDKVDKKEMKKVLE